jgi:hypothetical protein
LNADPFFTQHIYPSGRLGVCPKAKMLIAMKLIGYGISPSGFQDYFQMGITTARKSMLKFLRIISCSALRDIYLRSMTREDAKRVSAMHRAKHGVNGMLGSLDCMHVHWKNCPVLKQGHYKGAKHKPTALC